MASAANLRRSEVLRAVVTDYIASQQPVGSKALLERHKLNVSSATIRNDMAVLESEGYIVQEHASSGRVPTAKGYRAFVDTLHEVKPLSPAERRAIITFLEGGMDLEDVLRRSVQLLAQLTQQAAVVQVPVLTTSVVRHCEVVALTPLRLLLVVITDNGRVEQRNVELDSPISSEQVMRLKELFNNALSGKTLAAASASLQEVAQAAPPDLLVPASKAVRTLVGTLVERPADRLIMAGASNLLRNAAISPRGLRELIDTLEQQVVMLKLMADLPEVGDVNVRIGGENEAETLQATSVVTTAYGNVDEAPLGGMGVVGPTYMDYSGTISKVAAVARYVGRILANE